MRLDIEYIREDSIKVSEFIDILNRSTLAKRRPVDDIRCIEDMIKNADIIITARLDQNIVGVARAVSDYSYCCYLSDLAVDSRYQKRGIGKKLINRLQQELQKSCKIVLLSAPDAVDYYPRIGFKKHNSAWVLS
jgi:predicted N-acetyltransferase YhbS